MNLLLRLIGIALTVMVFCCLAMLDMRIDPVLLKLVKEVNYPANKSETVEVVLLAVILVNVNIIVVCLLFIAQVLSLWKKYKFV